MYENPKRLINALIIIMCEYIIYAIPTQDGSILFQLYNHLYISKFRNLQQLFYTMNDLYI